MKTFSLILSLIGVFAVGPSFADELTLHDMELWANARFGPPDGEARYWYGRGPVRDVETGETLYTFEYYDTVRHIIDPDNPNRHYGLVSKLDFFRDKDTDELLESYNGNPVKPWLFPYQLLEVEFKDGKVLLTVSQGKGEFLRVHEFPESSITRHGQNAYIYIPGFFTVRRPEIPNQSASFTMTSYFIVCEESCGDVAPPIEWVQFSTGTLAPWAGGDGTQKTHSFNTFQRFDEFAELPQHVRAIVESDYPEWRTPPRDLDHVRSMQQ